MKCSLPAALAALILLAGCAAGPNPLVDAPDPSGDVAGFLRGLWHGFIVLFTFLVSLFRDDVTVYAVHNTGATYDLGFVIGVMMFFGGGGGGASCSRRGGRRRD